MRPEIIEVLILGSLAAGLVAAALYAIFARPAFPKAKLYRQEVISGFLGVAGIVVLFACLFIPGFLFDAAKSSGEWRKPAFYAAAAVTFLLITALMGRYTKHLDNRIESYGAKPGASNAALLFLVTFILVIGFLVSDKSPRSLLMVSIAPPAVVFSYGTLRDIHWKRFLNIPMAAYFFYCSGVLLYYLQTKFLTLFAICFGLALWFTYRAIAQKKIASREIKNGATRSRAT